MCTKPDEARTLKEIEGVETMVEGGVDARDAVGSLGIARLAVEAATSIQIPSEDPNLSDEERQKLDELHANADSEIKGALEHAVIDINAAAGAINNDEYFDHMSVTPSPNRTWNYRVLEFTCPLSGEVHRAIHSVYYADGKPVEYGQDPAVVLWGVEEPAPFGTLDKFRRALEEEVLLASSFG